MASVTDLIGIRIVTLFSSEIVDALRVFLEVLYRQREDLVLPFRPSVEECRLYVSGHRANRDKLAGDIGRVLTKFDIEPSEPEERVSASSSVHLVSRLEHEPLPHLGDDYRIPVEIQILSLIPI